MLQRSCAFQLALVTLFAVGFPVWLRDPPFELHAPIHVIPIWVALACLALSIRFFRLSDGSFALLVGFLALHAIGARYIYSHVPYDAWVRNLLGASVSDTFDLSRNHFDRFVHFAYGLLIAPVAREVKLRITGVSQPWSYLAAVEFVLATSLLFELAEWGGAMHLAPDFADSYLGQQGDAWDAHQDMALATAGAVLSMVLAALFARSKAPPPPC
jgi:putative membrane protein